MAATVTSLDDYRVKNEVRENAVAEIENGYTRIANELLEAIAGADLTVRQIKILLTIVRKTYGFGKKLDRITNTQIAEITGIHHTHVCKAKNEMISMNILILEKGRIGINKKISEWNFNISQNSKTLANSANDNKLAKSANKSLAKLANVRLAESAKHKRNLLKKKENTPLTPHEGNDEKLISNNRKNKIPYQEILQVYNETVGDRLPNAESLNDKRKQAIGKFWKELKNPSVDAARNYFEVFVETANPWYFGENDRGWRASFDYLLRPDTVTKTREGAL
ncbi:replication protein [Arsenophonus nasoniae]|uniref:Replication protein n=1 Tax=Arsenophonus nasoniae TaxID=638 RepID=A0A4P7KZH6_9GAMM|nr:replication protein [Arsenophonus nasoniae]QBY44150.1 Bacteriophage replication protein O [Arsenophonus nasoniae]WGM01757.1 replication protein [Arsenophonus nasoniae]WGM04427.1 replication protein [Arsenophonus nasoniae]WGM09556.1 replication protein [Arsenophonus nasoniae]WGM09807.1 replication protein [Arsenophonus nasoniae]